MLDTTMMHVVNANYEANRAAKQAALEESERVADAQSYRALCRKANRFETALNSAMLGAALALLALTVTHMAGLI